MSRSSSVRARNSYDVVIIGGATAGSAVAWFLSANPDFDGSVLVVERDPSWSRSATIASNNCMRQQFATEINVTIAQYAAEFVRNFRENLGGSPDIPDIPIRNFGYLYLADNEDFADILRRDQALQAACGAGTRMLTGEQIASAYPFYHLDDIVAGSLNTVDEGAFDALTMVDWLRRKAVDNGVDYIHNEVVAIKRVADRIETILLRSGETITAGIVIDAAGTRAAHLRGWAAWTYRSKPAAAIPTSSPSTHRSIRTYRSPSNRPGCTCAPTVPTTTSSAAHPSARTPPSTSTTSTTRRTCGARRCSRPCCTRGWS